MAEQVNIIKVYHSTNVVKEKVKKISDIIIPSKLDIPGMVEISSSVTLEDIKLEAGLVESKDYSVELVIKPELFGVVKNIYGIEISKRVMDLVTGVCFGISLVDYSPVKGVNIGIYGSEPERVGYEWVVKWCLKKYGFKVNLMFGIGLDLFGIYKTGDIVNDSEYRSICNKIDPKTKCLVMYFYIKNILELKRAIFGVSKYLEVMGCLVLRIPVELVACDIVKLLIVSFVSCYIRVEGGHVIMVCYEKDNGFDSLYMEKIDYTVKFNLVDKIEKLNGKIAGIVKNYVPFDWIGMFGY
jgi:hypothetical protein